MTTQRNAAFTLIELLIVVAIIAILAAIAVPNFLEAQVRAKVAAVKGDLKTYALALESYHLDWNKYPIRLNAKDGIPSDFSIVGQAMTTPIAYISHVNGNDPFNASQRAGVWDGNNAYEAAWRHGHYQWRNYVKTRGSKALTQGDSNPNWPNLDACVIFSLGPLAKRNDPGVALNLWWHNQKQQAYNKLYDPSNGTVSEGAIFRFQGDTRGFPLAYN